MTLEMDAIGVFVTISIFTVGFILAGIYHERINKTNIFDDKTVKG